MVDPLLEGFDMPLLVTFPIASKDVPRLDAVLVTHSDNDHYSVPTNKALASVTRTFHSTHYVDPGRDDLGAGRLAAHSRAPPRHARPRRDAVRPLRQRVALRPGGRGADGERVPRHAAPALPLGSMNAPAFTPFNGDPWRLFGLVKNPGRIRVLAPGEAFTLTRVRKT